MLSSERSKILPRTKTPPGLQAASSFSGLFTAAFTFLVRHAAGGFAGGLAGRLAFAAASGFLAFLEIAGRDRLDSFHG
jgi:hypothetical protein